MAVDAKEIPAIIEKSAQQLKDNCEIVDDFHLASHGYIANISLNRFIGVNKVQINIHPDVDEDDQPIAVSKVTMTLGNLTTDQAAKVINLIAETTDKKESHE